MSNQLAIHWFRRDLRLQDNAALYHALRSDYPVLPLFIFDRHILDELPENDARVHFIHNEIQRLRAELEEQGSSLLLRYGKPEEIWQELLEEYSIAAVYTNRDYEPYARKRDTEIARLLLEEGDIPLHTYKDQVIFEQKEIEKKAGGVYSVFSPYARTWKKKLKSEQTEDGVSLYLAPYATEAYFSNFYQTEALPCLSLADMNFKSSDIEIPSREVSQKVIKQYGDKRNYPAEQGTSRLGVHFRFGTISIRQKARKAQGLSETYLNELIWRDFYAMILANHPKVVHTSFREKYDAIEWRNNEGEFEAWCQGKTGYPMVDAGMRQLNQTGYMHNRVRMVTASFLTKHLLIDWRWGEAYFAEKLLDYELSSNNGGWQWASGGGTDAAPYFRIFNPSSQVDKYDKDKAYIKKWLPEYGTSDYPKPIVEHKAARERCLERYKTALNKAD